MDLTVVQLRNILKRSGAKGYSKLRKAELIKLVSGLGDSPVQKSSTTDPLIDRWMMGMSNPKKWLDDILSIYTYDFLSSPTEELVRQTLLRSPSILKHTRLITMKKYMTSETSLLKSLMYRFPVYFGSPQTEMYDNDQVYKVLGYDPDDDIPLINKNRYVICGKAVTTHPRKCINVIHAWGVNLESRYTDDYKILVKAGKLNRPQYKKLVNDTIYMILSATAETKQNYIRIPLIGLGAFLGSCPPQDQDFAKTTFFEAISTQLARFEHVHLALCIFDSSVKRETYYKKWFNDSTTQALIDVGMLTIESDLFDVSSYSASDNVYLVNAWDDKSFIGNGGSQDPTIDGFMIAGTGPGKKLVNTSYLHNAFFSTVLLNPKNWIVK